MREKQGATTTSVLTYGSALLRDDSEYPLFDGQGSTRTYTNSGQTVTATESRDSFGLLAGSTGTIATCYRYGATSGYRRDGDPGLITVGARYYDPNVGRFITRDTVLTEYPSACCDHDCVCASPTYLDILRSGSSEDTLTCLSPWTLTRGGPCQAASLFVIMAPT